MIGTDMLTVAEAAATLGSVPRVVRRWIACGRLHAVRAGPLWLVPAAEVERFNQIPRGRGIKYLEGEAR